MNKRYVISLLIVMVIIGYSLPCFGGWIVFRKPAYKGKIIDAETKEPIEGVAVVAIYQKHPFISGPGGGSVSTVKVKETITDKNGEFRISSCFALMGPNSYEEYTNFIFYKPGYGHYTKFFVTMDGDALEYYLLEENYGKNGDIFMFHPRRKIGEGTYGVVELNRATTWEERRIVRGSGLPSDISPKKWPILHDMFEKERKWIGENRPRRR